MSAVYSTTIRKLVDAYEELTPELQKAARYMIDHPDDVGLNSMRTIAGAADVKPATISRLSKELGFAAYRDLRQPFRDRLREARGPDFSSQVRNVQQRGRDDMYALYEDFRNQDISNIERTISEEQYPVLVDTVETIWSSRRVYVLGLRGAFAPAFLFHYAFQLFRDRCHQLDTTAGIFADQLRGIGEQDSLIAIAFPPYTQLTIDAVGYAAESGAKVIAITDSLISPVATSATHTLVSQTDSASFYHSFTATVSLCQALIALLVARSGVDAVNIARQAEMQLSRISAYW
jgi:DNA-binding MurR/RpiR family transcriptional regulator